MATLRMKGPLGAQMELTKACNFACLHCYNYWRYLENDNVCEQDDFSRSIDNFKIMLQKMIEKEVPSITFTGGEPLIRRDLLYPLVKMAKSAGMRTRVNTNGALIAKEDVEDMVESGVDVVLISFPSNIREDYMTITNSDGYDAALKAIDLISKTDISLQINMVVSTINLHSVKENGLFLKEHGVSLFCATPAVACPCAGKHSEISLKSEHIKAVLEDLLFLQDNGMSVEVLEPLTHCMFTPEERVRYAQFLSYRSCSAGISDVALSPDGDIRACILCNSVEGNIFTDGWEESWKKLERWASPDLLPKECLDCAAVDFCGGGCRVAALAKTGKLNGKDPYMGDIIEVMDSKMFTQCNSDHANHEIENDTQLVFAPRLKTRKEDFGGIIFCDNLSHLFLHRNSFGFLEKLLSEKNHNPFSVESISEEFHIDFEELRNFFSHLLRNKFIVKQNT